MDIKEFVATAIEQILTGVAESQQAALAKGATINPRNIHGAKGRANDDCYGFVECREGSELYQTRVTMVTFDLQVEARDREEGSISAGVRVIGGNTTTEMERAHSSRITFSVPIALPSSHPANAVRWSKSD